MKSYATLSKLSKNLSNKIKENEKVIKSFNKFKSQEMNSKKAPLMTKIISEDEKLKVQVELDVIFTSCIHSLELRNNTIQFYVNLQNVTLMIMSHCNANKSPRDITKFLNNSVTSHFLMIMWHLLIIVSQ